MYLLNRVLPFFRGRYSRTLPVCCGLLSLIFGSTAQVPLAISYVPDQRLQLTWDDASGTFALEMTDALGNTWQSVDVVPVVNGLRRTVEITPATNMRFFRLRQATVAPLTIASTSPVQGERGVAVTRESIFRLSQPMASDILITTNQLFALAGQRRVLSRIELSSDRRTVTLFYLENLPADTRIHVNFDSSGVFDRMSRPADLDGDGVIGGIAQLSFDTGSLVPLPTTGVEGHVFASEKTSTGTNRPLGGVTITVDGMEETLRAVTDVNGFFRLMPAPAGRFFVHVDGRTAQGSQWPGGAYYPFVGKAWDAVPGRSNNLAGGSGEVFLPLIQADALKPVSAMTETKITFAESVLATNPALAGVEIMVPPNALFSDNGTRGGRVGIAAVAPDRLPEPLPPGLNMPLVITIQTDGASNFDRPVPIKFPNLPDPVTGILLPPGAKTALWSFNHDTGRWEVQGPATVTSDGLFVVSDPGVGVLQPGWHGTAPGSGGGGPNPNRRDDDDDRPPRDRSDCSIWDTYCEENPCKKEAQLFINASKDLIEDLILAGIGGTGSDAADCAIGTGISGIRAARDCALDLDDCGEIEISNPIVDGAIGSSLGCIPKWGSIVGPLWTLKSVVLNFVELRECDENSSPQARLKVSYSSLAGQGVAAVLAELQSLLNRQIALSEAASNLMAQVWGAGVWAIGNSPEDVPRYQEFFTVLRSVLAANSPGGLTITADERTALLAAPRPNNASVADVDQLLSRLMAMTSGQFKAGDSNADRFIAAYAQFETVANARLSEGWTSLGYGLLRVLEILSVIAEPSVGSENYPAWTPPPQPSPQRSIATGSATPVEPAFPARANFFVLQNLANGFLQRGRLTDAGQFPPVIFQPQAPFAVSYFDPTSQKIGRALFTSDSAGRFTRIPAAPLLPDKGLDTDGDGLSDVAEFITGTDPGRADTDGDGLSDGAEISAGTNPSDGQPLSLGVIASRDTPGLAVELDTLNDFAVLADNTNGLAVFNVSDPLSPVRLAQINPPPGGVFSLFNAVATAGEFVAAVPGTNNAPGARIHIFRMLSSGALSPLPSALLGAVPATVVAAGRYAYVPARASNVATLAVVQLSDARVLRHVPVSGGAAITALAIDGDVLWALNSTRLLSYRISGDSLQPLGELSSTNLTASPLEPGPELTAGNGRVYVGAFTGFRVIDGSNPSAPVLLHTPLATQAANHDFALTGSGLLLPVVSFAGANTLGVGIYDIRNDRATNFLTSFDTPGQTRAIQLHRGYALAADGLAGLAVVNFLTSDRGTNPPTISLRPFVSHPPNSQEAELAFFVSTVTTDDVQVRDVEFHIDGVLVARCGKFPFAATLIAPALTATKTNFSLRAKATDTGGNSAWSDEMIFSLRPDLTPPRVVSVAPVHNSSPARGTVSALSAAFDSIMNLTSLQSGWTLANAGSDGNLGTADDVPVSGGEVSFDGVQRTALLRFNAPLLSGRYRARLSSNVTDLGANLLGTNVTWDFTIPAARAVSTTPFDRSVHLPGTLQHVEVRFDERLIPASIAPASFQMLTTNSVNPFSPPAALSVSSNAQSVVFDFPEPVPNGTYRFNFTPAVRDVYGSSVATNFPALLIVKGPTLWSNDLSGLWTVGTNWSIRTPPISNDHVVIDRPSATPTISLRTAATVTTIRSEEAFALDSFNGSLTVLDQAIFNGPLSMISGTTIDTPFLQSRGSASLIGTIDIGTEAVFEGPVTVNAAGDITLRGGRSRFFNRLDTTRNATLAAHVLTLEPGAVGTIADNQISFGGANSRFIIAPGARLEVIPTNTQFNANNFVGSQGETGARIENSGEFVKRGAASSSLTRVELINSGSLRIEQGLLSIGNDFTNTGTITVTNNASLDLGSLFRHGAAGRITGAGYVKMSDNAILDGAYEVTGTTEVSRAQSSAAFNASIHSTGSWLITGSATFNGASTELLGPVTLRGGQLILNSPGETRLADLRLEMTSTSGGNSLGGSGQLVFREERAFATALTIQDSLRIRFEVAANFTTNFIVQEPARVDLMANSRWTGGGLSGNIYLAPNVVLELTNTGAASLSLPFPQAGILRKTSTNTVSLSGLNNPSANFVTNRSLIDVLSGTISMPGANGSFFIQETGALRLAAGASFITDALRLLGGELTGSGTMSVRSSAVNRGCHLAAIISPGEPYGVLKFTGVGFPIWMAGSRTILDIGGATPGVNQDQIMVERTVQIDGGTLEIRTASGFLPALGQEFTIFTGSGRTGTFPEVTGLEIGSGRRYRVIYETEAIKLRVE